MSAKTTVARRLAEAICAVNEREERDEQVLHAAERLLLDSVGCALGATTAEPVRAVRAWARMSMGRPPVRILGTREESSVAGATMANCLLVRYLDMNDCDWQSDPAHPSDNIGTCISVAQATNASPMELLKSILIAFEVQMRTTEFTKVSFFRTTGWDVTTFVTLASAAAAGALLRLDPERMAHALSIAASYPTLGEVRVGQISMMKASASGVAGAHGVEAAYLAANGTTGPAEAFEGKRGLSKLVLGECNWDILTAPVGRWRLPRTNLKQYPAAYVIHAGIDAALALRRNARVVPNDIAEVKVSAFGWLIEDMVRGMGGTSRYEIDARETADHSLPYCVAVSLLDGAYNLGQLESRRWEAPEMKAMLAKVKCEHDPSMDQGFPDNRPVRIEVRMKNGEVITEHVPFPKGDRRNPLTDDDLALKARTLSAAVLSPAAQDRVIETALNLRRHSVGDLLEACTPAA